MNESRAQKPTKYQLICRSFEVHITDYWTLLLALCLWQYIRNNTKVCAFRREVTLRRNVCLKVTFSADVFAFCTSIRQILLYNISAESFTTATKLYDRLLSFKNQFYAQKLRVVVSELAFGIDLGVTHAFRLYFVGKCMILEYFPPSCNLSLIHIWRCRRRG